MLFTIRDSAGDLVTVTKTPATVLSNLVISGGVYPPGINGSLTLAPWTGWYSTWTWFNWITSARVSVTVGEVTLTGQKYVLSYYSSGDDTKRGWILSTAPGSTTIGKTPLELPYWAADETLGAPAGCVTTDHLTVPRVLYPVNGAVGVVLLDHAVGADSVTPGLIVEMADDAAGGPSGYYLYDGQWMNRPTWYNPVAELYLVFSQSRECYVITASKVTPPGLTPGWMGPADTIPADWLTAAVDPTWYLGEYTAIEGSGATGTPTVSVSPALLTVAGELTPDATGDYYLSGGYSATGKRLRPYWTNGTYYIWYYESPASGSWRLTNELGLSSDPQWASESFLGTGPVVGEYTAALEATGTATIAEG